MLKCFDLTQRDLELIQEIKNTTGAGSAREVVRRALEEYHKKIFNSSYPFGQEELRTINAVK